MEKGAENSSSGLLNNNEGKNVGRQFSGDDGGGGAGPTNSCGGGANEVVALGNKYSDDISSSSQKNGGEKFADCTNLLPFDSYSTIPYKSLGGEMVSSLGFPFTFDQWKELERQAMIYKYMISSLPVPPHLLFPFSMERSVSSMFNGRHSKNGDPEPMRCKRTDGKKWRCSRDVAPRQKYCERHLHRGRPRSRKPVEIKSNAENQQKKTRLEQKSSLPKAQSNVDASQQFVAANEPLLLFNAKTDSSICAPYQKGADRDLSLMIQGETVEKHGVGQPWQHWIESNTASTNEGYSGYTPIFTPDYAEQQPLSMFSYPNLPGPEIEPPIGFIDAWSIDIPNTENSLNLKSSISLNEENLSPSLNLSMAMAAENVPCCDDHQNKAKDSIWSGPFPCEVFARGGPLGEALHGSTPASPYSSVATNVSSPSGVIHRTLFSHSDGSVCNSPTFGAPPSEVSIQWFN